MANTQSKALVQFSLRSLLVAVLISVIGVANWRRLLELSFGYFYLFAILLLISAWWIAQRFRTGSIHQDSPRTYFSILHVGLPIVILACLLSLWIRHRWIVQYHENWPRSFPYPDEFLLVFHAWLDSQYPTEPGHIKIHGEFYNVWRYLNLAALGLCTLVGAMLGFMCRTNGPIGITYWRDRVASLYRKPT